MEFTNLLDKLTTEEKAALVAGTEFWKTNPVPRLDIPSIFLSDGPHGLRKQSDKADNFGLNQSEPATSFPTAATVAASWNPKNARKIGGAIAEECKHYGVNVVLGPGLNIKRNPLCGRNFEYYSEDPFLTGEMGAEFIGGVQEGGVAACPKHFAANNSEDFRFMGDSVVDERTLREIYLKAFEIVVKRTRPRAIMSSYNQINGTFASENKRLLTDVLRTEWGFDGLVMSDWGGTGERLTSLKAGLDLEMPGDYWEYRKNIINAVGEGRLESKYLDIAAGRVLRLISETYKNERESVDFNGHNDLACEIACDSAVLLKNENVLPLKSSDKFYVVGELFNIMRYQGAGSSLINPYKLTSPKSAFDLRGIKYEFERGYCENETQTDKALLQKALAGAKNYDSVLVFGGLTDYAEMEGCDRPNMRLPQNQLDLINGLIAIGKKVIFIMFGGAPVELPFFDKISGLLNMYLPGQNGGKATATLLFGEKTPCGKLPETWTESYADVPFGADFSCNENELYRESIYVGYRYYDAASKKVRFPFGYGLSYTSFEYSDLKVDMNGDKVKATCSIANIGNVAGAEIVQLYVKNSKSCVFKAEKELRAFNKVFLMPGEKKTVELQFNASDLSYYNVKTKSWVLENGEYTVQIGASSRDLKLESIIEVENQEKARLPYDDAVIAAYSDVKRLNITNSIFESLLGYKIPPLPVTKPLTMNSRFSLFKKRVFGKILYNQVMKIGKSDLKAALKMPNGPEKEAKKKNALFLIKILDSNCIRSFCLSSAGAISHSMAKGFVEFANGHIFKGLKLMKAKEQPIPLPKQK